MLTEHRVTPMAWALLYALMDEKAPARLSTQVARVATTRPNAGVIKTRAWDAHLSFKTAKVLQQKGILP